MHNSSRVNVAYTTHHSHILQVIHEIKCVGIKQAESFRMIERLYIHNTH